MDAGNEGNYTIGFDPATRRLSLRLVGFRSDATMDAFASELRTTIERIATTSARFDTLSDAGAFPIQSSGVAAKFGQLMHGLGAARHDRIAVLVASTLNKLQAERALGGDSVRVFLKHDDARAWLDGENG